MYSVLENVSQVLEKCVFVNCWIGGGAMGGREDGGEREENSYLMAVKSSELRSDQFSAHIA